MVPIIVAHVAGKEATRRRSFAISMAFIAGYRHHLYALGYIYCRGRYLRNQQEHHILFSGQCLCNNRFKSLGILRLNINFGIIFLIVRNLARLGGSYLLGLTMGLVGSQCGTPMLLVILSLALASGKWLYGASLLFVYALGRGVPVVLAGTFTGILSRMQLFAATSQALERVAGLIIILVGGYFFWIA